MKDFLFKKTKILATIGPSSASEGILTELAAAGADAFRLNFSHGTHAEHADVIAMTRSMNEKYGFNICLVQDLQGPKIRIREVENGAVTLTPGQELILTSAKIIGNTERIGTTYRSLYNDVKMDDSILLDDGNIELRVKRKVNEEVVTEVIYGGVLRSKKGMNLPKTRLSAPSLTEKDYEDLLFGLEHDVEWIALSFVRTAEDILSLREIIRSKGKDTRIIAKIEKPEALRNIDAIIDVSDAVMVARGDLGVETSTEELPMAQKMIVKKCNSASKPVIIATQMMESMINSPRPTRAETNDIANSVIDGADALMLSAETASGLYPVLTVKSMASTIRYVEEHTNVYDKFFDLDQGATTFYNDSVIAASCKLAKHTDAKALVGMTNSGYTAFRIARHRPLANIFIFTGNRRLLNTLNLVWGIQGIYYENYVSTDATIEDIKNILKEKGYLKPGDVLINTASMPIMERLRTNMIKLSIA